jgi:hypothetical protein
MNGATSSVTKVAMGIVAIGMVTAVLLRGNAAVGVLGGIEKLFSGSLNTAIKG